MASSKPDLSRAGTMEVTAKEGTTFLNKNLTEWKKPYLMPPEEAEDGDEAEDAAGEDGEDVPEVAPPTKKARMSKATTMVNTAKEAKLLLGGEKLADTRQETKARQQSRKSALKRASTMAKAKQEAHAVYGSDLDLSEGRNLRKRAQKEEEDEEDEEEEVEEKKKKKPSMKKAGTMQVTAKEGKAYLKRSKKTKTGKKKGKGKGKK